MQTKSYLTVLAAVLSIGSAAVSHTAFAQESDQVSVKVSTADLNLYSEAGAAAVLQRIRTAATTICGDQPSDPIARLHYRDCVNGVTSRTVAQMNNPMVTARYHGKVNVLPTALASVK